MADITNTIETVVKVDSNQAQQEIIKLNAAASDSTKELTTRVGAKNKQIEKQNQLSKQTITVLEEELKLLEGMGASAKDIEKAKKKLNAEKLKAIKVSENNTKAQNKLNQSLRDSKDPLKQLDKALFGVIGRFNAILANPIGAIISLLVGGFLLLKKALNSTEDGAAQFNTIMAAVGQVFTSMIAWLSDKLAPTMQWLADFLTKDLNPVFEALGGYIESLKLGFFGLIDVVNLLLTPYRALYAAVVAAGKAMDGDFEGAKQVFIDLKEQVTDTAKSMVKNFVKAGAKIVKTTKDIAKGFDRASMSTDNLINRAATIELMQNQLNKDKREQLLLDAKLGVQSKQALADAKDLDRAWQDRFQSLKDFREIEIERELNSGRILEREIKLLEMRASLGKNTREDEEALNAIYIEREKHRERLADTELLFHRRSKEFRSIEKKEIADAAVKKQDLKDRELEAQIKLDEIDLERRRMNGENVLELELEILERRRAQELLNTELTESERNEIIARYKLAEEAINKTADNAKAASNAEFVSAAISGTAQAFGFAKEAKLAEMIMAAPSAIGNSFAKASETYAPPLSIIMGAAGAAGVIGPIIKGVQDIKKTKLKGAPASASSTPTGGATSSISSAAANNASRVAVDPTLSQNATTKASANATGGLGKEVVFSEDKYTGFKEQVAFKEDKTTF